MRYATVVCIKGLLLTIHIVSPKLDLKSSHGVRLLNQDAVTHMMQRELPIGTTTGVLSAWLLFHLNHVSNEAHKLRKRIFELYEKMDDNIATMTAALALKVDVATLGSPSGVSTLNPSGQVNTEQLPTGYTGDVNTGTVTLTIENGIITAVV